MVRFDTANWTGQDGARRCISLFATNGDVKNWVYSALAQYDAETRRYETDLQIDGGWGRYQYKEISNLQSDLQGYLRIIRHNGNFSTYYWSECEWVPLAEFKTGFSDPIYIGVTIDNSYKANKPVPLASDFNVEQIQASEAVSGNWTPSYCSLIQPVPLPAKITLPEGVEAKIFNSTFPIGTIFFGPDGTTYAFSSERSKQKLIAIDGTGTARTYAESEILAGLNRKAGVLLGSNILMTVDGWDGGNRYSGIFELNPNGTFHQWNLKSSYGGLGDIISAPDGGWYFSDFKADNIWHLPAEGAEEKPLITKGDYTSRIGLIQLAYDDADGTLYALDNYLDFRNAGTFRVCKITTDGEVVEVAKINETSKMNGGMALSSSGPFGHALFVSDAVAGKILKVNMDGTTEPFITGLIKPGEMQFNPVNGDLLIICNDGKSLLWVGSDLSRVGTRLYEDDGIIYETSNQNKALSNAKVGDTYGMLRVGKIDNVTGRILRTNEDNTITLRKNRSIEIMPGISIKTADSDELRYYICKEVIEPGIYEIRGSVATDTFTWTAENFAGFYYDIDDNIKTEELAATISEGNKLLEPNGVVYTTTAQQDDFEYEPWGSYNVIGFMAEKYFAGYLDTPDSTGDVLFEESDDENVLSDKQLLQILVDNDDERTVTSGTPLAMKEGYELSIAAIDIDGNKVYLELSKDGAVVDSKVISPSKDAATMKDRTYYYKKDIGDSKDVVIVAAHFKNAVRGAEQNLATVDGLWQLSDNPRNVSENTEYDKMTIQTVTNNSISMDNEDNDITLSKNKDITLMPGVAIKTADSDNDDLRYYLYKEITEPGTYEIRGNVATDTFTWTADNFAGFYYDIDDNIKTEELVATISEGNKLLEPNGVVYTTKVMADDFEFELWGSYNAIGFMAEKYFAGYLDTPDSTGDVLFEESDDENVLSDEQLLQILVDNDDERTVTSGTPLALEEGYELVLKGISDEGRIYLNLLKDGELVDESFISPSVDGATIRDKTYYYCKDVGSQENLAIIAAHFKTTYKDEDYAMAVVDGIWQISETPLDVSENTVHGKMIIQTVTADSITMNNEDNSITLERKSDIELMPGIHDTTYTGW